MNLSTERLTNVNVPQKLQMTLILDAKNTLKESLAGKNLDRQLVQKALAKKENRK